ncbi:MAG: DnaJ domain-containing protein [Chloroflexi bacterium]|nr:DnaJ domain-containing protein [Chloroflexota bacterium]
MTAAMDPHSVLGLQPGASQAEIKRAYRRLAKALHPDSAGERSLPAFLAVQDAYERLTGTKVRTVRPTGPPAAPAASGGPFREPWRADPARARAAREQARTRSRGTPGTGPGTGGTTTGSGPSDWSRAEQRARPTSGPERRAGATGRAPGGRAARESATTDAPGTPAGGQAGRRRRPARKATMGSTSYDEAREATDPRWGGASWYGPTTGEYWIVNPREYADPRKHGPGYSSRQQTGPGDAAEPGLDEPAPDEAPPHAPDRPIAGPMNEDTSARSAEAATPPGQPAVEPFIDSIIRPGPSDPLRRLGLVLLAWAPVGIAAAAVLGQLTGCASFSAACDGTDPFLPWVAQAILVGLLLVAPALARIFAAGTFGLIVGLVPATALVLALGGGGSSAAPAVLAAVLAIAWVLGAGWGLRRLLPALAADHRPTGAGTPQGRGTP